MGESLRRAGAQGATERVAAVQQPAPPTARNEAKRKKGQRAAESVDGAPSAPSTARPRRRSIATPAAAEGPALQGATGPGLERRCPPPAGGGGLDADGGATAALADAQINVVGGGGGPVGGDSPPSAAVTPPRQRR
ncbi:hypothetical protein I4F81_003189 [Pyropia yezoensis]|uniref:Uncharacterized protein n=1 Tax=Pyropia yezoensis TaxID=2788 RepID=A0ACC3BT20_PYRYE|nr:hypothetical protein I4F81_003189 [Neopyropia yezoensis]